MKGGNKMHKFSRHFLFIENKDQVIIGNKYRCTYIKISKECYEILEQLIKSKIDAQEYSKVFEEKEDLEYFLELIEILIQKRILVDSGDEEIVESFDVQWEVTNQCNLKCKHCIADAVATEQLLCKNDEIYSITDKIISMSPKSLTITGGEPMLLPFFFELSKYIKEQYQNEMMLMTNGTYITAENAKQIANLYNGIYISVDGVSEETCRTIRGAGVFGKVMNAIQYLKDVGMEDISLSMVLTNENRVYKDEFYEMCSRLEVTPMLRSFAAVGRGENHQDWYITSDDNLTHDDSVANDFVIKRRTGQPDVKFGACGGRYGSVTIGPKGDVFLCAPYEYNGQSIGNIAEMENVKDFFCSEKFKETTAYKEFEMKMPENHERCKTCNVQYFCWHCPFIFEQAIQNDRLFDKYCENKKKDLAFAIWGEV